MKKTFIILASILFFSLSYAMRKEFHFEEPNGEFFAPLTSYDRETQFKIELINLLKYIKSNPKTTLIGLRESFLSKLEDKNLINSILEAAPYKDLQQRLIDKKLAE